MSPAPPCLWRCLVGFLGLEPWEQRLWWRAVLPRSGSAPRPWT
jgi:hypothetical protein